MSDSFFAKTGALEGRNLVPNVEIVVDLLKVAVGGLAQQALLNIAELFRLILVLYHFNTLINNT